MIKSHFIWRVESKNPLYESYLSARKVCWCWYYVPPTPTLLTYCLFRKTEPCFLAACFAPAPCCGLQGVGAWVGYLTSSTAVAWEGECFSYTPCFRWLLFLLQLLCICHIGGFLPASCGLLFSSPKHIVPKDNLARDKGLQENPFPFQLVVCSGHHWKWVLTNPILCTQDYLEQGGQNLEMQEGSINGPVWERPWSVGFRAWLHVVTLLVLHQV